MLPELHASIYIWQPSEEDIPAFSGTSGSSVLWSGVCYAGKQAPFMTQERGRKAYICKHTSKHIYVCIREERERETEYMLRQYSQRERGEGREKERLVRVYIYVLWRGSYIMYAAYACILCLSEAFSTSNGRSCACCCSLSVNMLLFFLSCSIDRGRKIKFNQCLILIIHSLDIYNIICMHSSSMERSMWLCNNHVYKCI